MGPFLYMALIGMVYGLGYYVVEYSWGRLWSPAAYLLHYRKKVDELGKSFEALKNQKGDVRRMVEAAERNGDVIDDVVSNWLRRVGELEECVGRLVIEAEENKRCFKGCCSDWSWRYKLGKEATEKEDDNKKLREEGNFLAVSQPSLPPRIDLMPERDFVAFSSTRDAMDKVMDEMRDKKKQLIGIYGMGGVGKTSLMDELGRKFAKGGEFGTVVKVVVSQNPNIAQVRREIAEELGMKLWGDGESAARKLADRLKKEDNIVIMMDDIWDRLELREIGIPNKEEHKGCKILFTTRTLQACKLMESHATILVDVLTEEDSWNFFKSKVGEVSEFPDIEPVARKVADECGGLPLAIVVLGRALRGCNKTTVWEDSLKQLKRSIPYELLSVEERLFKSLELSYNYIKNVEMKLLFLFCCLFREDYEISEDELTRYAVGDGFLRNTYTLDEARSKVHLLVEGLVASCLLLSTDQERHVKMHDVVRDVAVYIASKGEDCFIVKAGLGMRDWPECEELQVCKRISLMNNDIWILPDQPKCPKLLTLLLNINLSLSGLTHNFFQGMPSLTVLDLSYTDIKSLPTSLALLTNLGSLRLDTCKKLRDITLIGQLKNLKILSLQKCPLNILPEGLGNLSNLKLLDISHCSSLKIPPHLIDKLSRLEELFMMGNIMNELLFVEIGSLKRLVNLHVYVKDVKYFSQEVEVIDGWNNLSRFVIYAQLDWYRLATLYRKNLFLKKVNQIANWTKVLLREVEDLRLDDCSWDLGEGSGWVNLKKLHLVNCGSIGSLLNGEHPKCPPNALANLERLYLANLENFEEICNIFLPAHSLEKLRILDILRCQKLVSVMPCHLLRRIHRNLQELSMNSCGQMSEVLNSEGIEEGTVILPQLRRLKLISLPNVVKLWTGAAPAGSLQNLSYLLVQNCNKLEYLFSQESLDSHLKIFPPGTFANLKELSVVSCPYLAHLFLPSLAHELQRLEKLEVRKNRLMKEIIVVEGGVVLDKGAFPRLKEVSLVELPVLESFYSLEREAVCFNWPSLEYIKLENCRHMKRFPIGLESAPKLKKVNVGNGDDAEWFQGLAWEDDSIPSRYKICKGHIG
ncbi:putative disease resistance protein isoform X2 [Iris pallida]|uniref:Disease resistance protein isoform X2 n=1 Tax=Iris pallida TaxID=29817 RepID=A0AAX6E0I6_IRIPA|nr:putative disease resistance protein isoform X2 [Iris pallida]